MEGCADGTFQMTGQKYFDCPDGRGLFFPLVHLKPDERFTDPGATPAVPANRKYYIVSHFEAQVFVVSLWNCVVGSCIEFVDSYP